MPCKPRLPFTSDRLRCWLLGLLLAAAGVLAGEDSADLAVVVSPEVPMDEISTEELRKILMGDRRFWEPGKPVTILIQAPVSWERDFVIGKVMDMSEAEFRQFWISKVFRAEATAGPKVVLSNDMAAALVNKIPGAVAFIRHAEVGDDVKVLKVDGMLPGSPDYPL